MLDESSLVHIRLCLWYFRSIPILYFNMKKLLSFNIEAENFSVLKNFIKSLKILDYCMLSPIGVAVLNSGLA